MNHVPTLYKQADKRDVVKAFVFPVSFVVLLWIIYFIGRQISFNLALLGLQQLTSKDHRDSMCSFNYLISIFIYSATVLLLVIGF